VKNVFLLEDEISHGGYSNFRTITLDSSVGDIAAGTYPITNINSSARTVSFTYVSANNSGALAFTADFYAYRIAGSTTTARIFSARGLSLVGANDLNGYFMSGGLRRRGYVQGHRHNLVFRGNEGVAGSIGVQVEMYNSNSGGNAATNTTSTSAIYDPKTDGINGTPLTAKITHGPAMSGYFYIHLRRYAA